MPQNLSQLESIPNNGEIPTYAELPAQNKELLAQNAALLEQVHQMREEMQSLRDEIARLKKQKPKPTIRPSKLTQKEKKQRKRRNAKKRGARQFDETKVVKAENVPEGSRFKGYEDFFVQELRHQVRDHPLP